MPFTRFLRVVVSFGVAVLFGSLAVPARAATTTYTSAYAGGTIAPGDRVVLNDGATITGPITDNGTLQFNQTSGTLTMSSTLTGSGTLSLTNAGTLMLTGTTVSVGVGLDMTTTVDSGRLLIGNNGGRTLYLGNTNGGAGTLSINGGYVGNGSSYLGFSAGGQASVTVSSGTWTNGSFTYVGWDGSGTLDVTGGSVTGVVCSIGRNLGSVGSVTVSGGTMSYTSNLTVGDGGTGSLTIGNGGLVALRGNLVRGAAGTISLNAGGTLQIGTGTNSGVLLGGTGSLTNNGTVVFNRSNASTYAGVLSGSGAVTKLGLGTLTLSGSSSYTGATAVDGGTMLVNGQLGNTAVAVNATGLLGGSGTILGGVTVASSGTLAPGSSPGVLTVGSLSLSAGSHTLMEITGTSSSLYDQIVGTGAGGLTYGGSLNLVMTGSYANQTTFDLFNSFSSNTGDFFAVGLNATGEYAGLTFTGDGGVWTSTATARGQRLVFSTGTGDLVVVPEPSTYAMAFAGLAYGGYMIFRRRKQA
jgi:autotransporter-associated beta strand protein/T5SS/PEP-CTERM-associated repeat protein